VNWVTQIHLVQVLIMCGIIPLLSYVVSLWSFIKREEKYIIYHLQISSKNRSSSYSVSNRRQKLRRGWLRHCATNRDVPGSIPGRVLVKFQMKYSFCPHSVALGPTQLLTEIGTRNISCGIKAAGA